MHFVRLLLVFVWALTATSFGADAVATKEIDYLIKYIEASDCRFIRNGKEYSAKEGAAHMRDKLGNAGGRVKTAEDFIKGIATKSYFTGDRYMLKTPTGELKPTDTWLIDALGRFRQKGSLAPAH